MNFAFFDPVNVSQAGGVAGFNYYQGDYDRFHALNPARAMTSSEDNGAFITHGGVRELRRRARRIVLRHGACRLGRFASPCLEDDRRSRLRRWRVRVDRVRLSRRTDALCLADDVQPAGHHGSVRLSQDRVRHPPRALDRRSTRRRALPALDLAGARGAAGQADGHEQCRASRAAAERTGPDHRPGGRRAGADPGPRDRARRAPGDARTRSPGCDTAPAGTARAAGGGGARLAALAGARRPAVARTRADGDNNSWAFTRLGVATRPAPVRSWRLYRATVTPPRTVAAAGGTFAFAAVAVYVELWIGGTRAATKTDAATGPLAARIPAGAAAHRVALIVDAAAGVASGIVGRVTIVVSS